MKNRYQIVVTETVDSYIEIETEQEYTKIDREKYEKYLGQRADLFRVTMLWAWY